MASITRMVFGNADTARNTGWSGDSIKGEAITMADLRRDLFNFEVIDAPLFTEHGAVPSHKAQVHSGTGHVLAVVGADRPHHDYSQWLTTHVEQIVDSGDLAIQSAGLLNGGRRAWVQIGTPDTITGPGGFEYRPFIGAYTGLDTSSTYKDNSIAIVCSNTYAASLKDVKHRISVRHTKNAEFDVMTAREALGIVFTNSDAFNAELDELLNVSVSDMQWENLVRDLVNPSTDSKRSVTMASNKTDALMDLWRDDPRVSPWKYTGLGAMQALSTYRQWVQTVKGADRIDRNMANVIDGLSDKADVTDAARIFALA